MSRVSGLEAPEQAVWARVPAQAVRQEDSGGQRSLACCRPRAHRVNHDLATEQLIKKHLTEYLGPPQGPVELTQKIHLHRSGCLVED